MASSSVQTAGWNLSSSSSSEAYNMNPINVCGEGTSTTVDRGGGEGGSGDGCFGNSSFIFPFGGGGTTTMGSATASGGTSSNNNNDHIHHHHNNGQSSSLLYMTNNNIKSSSIMTATASSTARYDSLTSTSSSSDDDDPLASQLQLNVDGGGGGEVDGNADVLLYMSNLNDTNNNANDNDDDNGQYDIDNVFDDDSEDDNDNENDDDDFDKMMAAGDGYDDDDDVHQLFLEDSNEVSPHPLHHQQASSATPTSRQNAGTTTAAATTTPWDWFTLPFKTSISTSTTNAAAAAAPPLNGIVSSPMMFTKNVPNNVDGDGILEPTPIIEDQNHHHRVDASTTTTTTTTDIGQIDEIVEALNKLTFEQREDVFDDLHGINRRSRHGRNSTHTKSYGKLKGGDGIEENEENDDIEEDPDMIQHCLREFDKHLTKQFWQSKRKVGSNDDDSSAASNSPLDAFKLAIEQDSSYIRDVDFRLAFLRADEYDPKLASDRLINFLHQKLLLFGRDKLTKDITLTDLNEQDISCLTCGMMQVLPLKDRSGRTIVVALPALETTQNIPSYDNMLRAMFYTMMSLVKGNVKSQTLGIVEMLYTVGHYEPTDFNLVRKKHALRSSLPMKPAAVHVCTDNAMIKAIVKFARPLMNLHTTSRIRISCGRHIEVQYGLMSFGIPLVAFPVDANGTCSNEFQKLWVEQRRDIELQRNKPPPPKAEASYVSVKEQISPGTNSVKSQDGSSNRLVEYMLDEPTHRSVTSSSELREPASAIGSLNSVPSPSVSAVPEKALSTSTSQRRPKNVIRMKDSNSSSDDNGDIFLPRDEDILLGRGRMIDQHPGNIQFRKYLQQEAFLKHYKKAKRCGKSELADCIQNKLRTECNVRFLIENQGTGRGWILAEKATVREKILRTLRRFVLPHNDCTGKAKDLPKNKKLRVIVPVDKKDDSAAT